MGLAQQGGIIVSRMQLSTSPLLPSTPSSRPRPRLRGHSRIKELGVSPRKGNVIAGSLQHPAVQSASAPRGPWHRGPHVLLRPAAPPFAGPGGRGGSCASVSAPPSFLPPSLRCGGEADDRQAALWLPRPLVIQSYGGVFGENGSERLGDGRGGSRQLTLRCFCGVTSVACLYAKPRFNFLPSSKS